jgi:VWFA-related protein
MDEPMTRARTSAVHRRPRLHRLAAAIAAVLLAAGPAAGQEGRVFRGGTDTVLLSVTVVNSAGQFIGGLDREQFQVFEDGVPQDIAVFSREQQPIALSILLDTSTSMEDKLGIAQQAAIAFVRRLRSVDVAQVIDFDSQAVLRQTFTSDKEALETAIRRTQAGGSTSLYNAIAVAVNEQRHELERSDGIRRQAIIVLSDGEDTSSLYGYEDVLELSRKSWITVYAVGLRSDDRQARSGFQEAEFALRTLSQETGGRAFFVEDVSELPGVYQQIADELENQYVLGYTSKNSNRDRAWRQIVVQVARPGAAARTKAGYFAPGPAR